MGCGDDEPNRAAWRSAVNQMLNGACNFALPAAGIATAAQIRTFTDTGTGKSYCLLMEVLDNNNNGKVDRGWGAFMVNANATLGRSVTRRRIRSPTWTTENESIGVFGGTDSRSWLMAGAHRMAASGSNSCQSSYGRIRRRPCHRQHVSRHQRRVDGVLRQQ